MGTPRIFTAQPMQPGATVPLEPRPSHHLARALRVKLGDTLILFDGKGGEYSASVAAIDKKIVSVFVSEALAREAESPLDLHLGIAISRGDRMDWIVQKATELGVTSLSPLFCERTEIKLQGERLQKKTAHWKSIAISACEQCGRNRLPVIGQPLSLHSWLAATRADMRLVLHHRAERQAELSPTASSVALLIGPEGGLSAAEIDAAESLGYRSLQLGPRILRTETAPLAAIAIVQAKWGDMTLL